MHCANGPYTALEYSYMVDCLLGRVEVDEDDSGAELTAPRQKHSVLGM